MHAIAETIIKNNCTWTNQIRHEPMNGCFYQCVWSNLCRCASPQCRSAGRRGQRGAAASGGPDPGPPSSGAFCSDRPGTGHGGGAGPGEEGEARWDLGDRWRRRWLPSKGCRRRKAWWSDNLLRLSSACSAFFVLSTGKFSGDVSFALSTLTLILPHRLPLSCLDLKISPVLLLVFQCPPDSQSLTLNSSYNEHQPLFFNFFVYFFMLFLLFLDLEVNRHLKPCSNFSAFYI